MSNIKKALTIGQKIKTARKSVGMSQKDLGSAIGLSDKAVSSYEVGRATPPVSTLREISNLTYKSVTYFMNDEDEEVDIETKLSIIEKELSEIKQLLKAKKS